MNKLILGDCLEIMKEMSDECIDLIYLDPPFFSNRNYEVIWGDAGEIRSFQDRWSGGIDHYIAWLKERVEVMYRLLKPTGSIYLHCDWHANAYIRVDILDKLFGHKNFRNEIAWKRTTTHNDHKRARQYGRVTDTIFYYSKNTKKNTFKVQFEHYASNYIMSSYNRQDPDGRRFKASDLSAPNGGISTSFEWKGVLPPKNRYWSYSKENLDEFELKGLIYWSSNGRPYLKNYFDEMPGSSIDDFWNNCVFKTKNEKIGYPTQKPESLMERIIKASSNEGDIILDPFMGGGTSIAVADKLKRKWIGIDQSVQAVKVTELRLDKQQDLYSEPFTIQLHKYDYDTLRNKPTFEFETWIIQQFGGVPQNKKGSDKGVDGKTQTGEPIQVKRSDGISRAIVDNFKSSIERYDKKLYEKNIKEKKTVGYLIAFSFTSEAIKEVARLKNKEGIIIELILVEKIVPLAKKPTIIVETNTISREEDFWRIEIIATGNSEAGIEFYSWDFDYDETEGFKADVWIDKVGKQILKLDAGLHKTAVKAIDNEGLEGIEIIQIKVNGKVEIE